MFNPGDALELEGLEGKYIVLKSVNDLGKIYLVLAEESEPTILKYCVLDGSEIKIIQDPKIIEYISNKIETN